MKLPTLIFKPERKPPLSLFQFFDILYTKGIFKFPDTYFYLLYQEADFLTIPIVYYKEKKDCGYILPYPKDSLVKRIKRNKVILVDIHSVEALSFLNEIEAKLISYFDLQVDENFKKLCKEMLEKEIKEIEMSKIKCSYDSLINKIISPGTESPFYGPGEELRKFLLYEKNIEVLESYVKDLYTRRVK